jgi:formamidopyrimidine-DNA glycosylase
MPEGPEIRRAADAVETALKGLKTTAVWFAQPRLKRFEASLTGIEVTAVDTRGKAMLTRFLVFRRAGLPCYRCGTPIAKVRRGGQPCYLCPRCQKVAEIEKDIS